MAKNFDLTSPQWLEMVFKGKNREYGAYAIRRDSSGRHAWAMLITLLLVAGIIFLPGLFKSNASTRGEEYLTIEDQVIMRDLGQEIPEEQKIEKPIEVPPPPTLRETIKLTPPVIGKDTEVSEEDLMKTQQELTDSKADISIADVKDGTKDGIDIRDLEDNIVIVNKSEPEKRKPFERAEQMPQFPGGDAALMKWLGDNLVYPTIAAELGRQGTVTLRFVVTETGDIGEVQIIKGTDKDLDKEAVRVVGKLPKFIPGRQNGQVVPVWFTLPVKFRLQ